MVLPQVTVLGCGPSGLVAAEAARVSGFRVLVLSRKRPSQLWGCQYLHAPIRSLPKNPKAQPSVDVNYILDGPAEGYLDKVYGEDYDGTVSPQEITELHRAYDLRATYRQLWDRWQDRIVDTGPLSAETLKGWLPDFTATGIVLSTLPRRVWCASPKHTFASVDVWAMGDSDEQRVPIQPPQDNMVICNGHRDVGWYRCSRVFGYSTVEWPWRDGRKPPFEGVVKVEKPLYTDCTCAPAEVQHYGRYGAWRKGVLVHQVYDEVLAHLASVQEVLF